eukprot:9410736-Alexandrium_andersonii.AAC.1
MSSFLRSLTRSSSVLAEAPKAKAAMDYAKPVCPAPPPAADLALGVLFFFSPSCALAGGSFSFSRSREELRLDS